ncbi:hypothetical protein C8J57DRAFT_1727572 [Mycena rebaudengoi]|nr:hypothetical protein C8J57DRAFT_1727572 [Mycena rebaudengoi]
MSHQASEFHTVNQNIYGGMGGSGGVGGEKGGSGGPGEGPMMSYDVKTEQFIVNNLGSAQMNFMLSGVAGSGKSTIAKTVATILANNNRALAASFFFSRSLQIIVLAFGLI